MSSETAPFTAIGERVEVRPPKEADIPAYAEAVTRSARRLAEFAVPDPDNLPAVIANQSPSYRTFMVLARDPDGEHGLVGRVNVSGVVRGAFRSATMGYDAYDPYAGRGLFAEGLALVVGLVFTDEPQGMGLHRLEANIQPANVRSAGLVRSLGFVHEGFSRDYLYLPGPDGRRAWRDHDRYAVLSSDWPAVPYRRLPAHRLVAVVNATPTWDSRGLARQLSAELGVPLLSTLHVPAAEIWTVLESSPAGGIVEGHFSGPELRMGLARARLDPKRVPVFDAAPDVSKRDVTGLALRVRAAYA